MKHALTALVVATIVLEATTTARADSSVFVEADIRWRKGDQISAPVKLEILKDDQRSIGLKAKLRSLDDKRSNFKFDLQSGYLLYCGTWMRRSVEEIVIRDHLKEAFRFPPVPDELSADRERVFKAAGKAWGILTDQLVNEDVTLVRTPSLHVDQNELASLWSFCDRND